MQLLSFISHIPYMELAVPPWAESYLGTWEREMNSWDSGARVEVMESETTWSRWYLIVCP